MPDYQQSRFTTQVPVQNGQEQMIAAYHLISRAFTLVPESIWQCLPDGVAGDAHGDLRDQLLSQGILVKAGTDELSVLDLWFRQYVHDTSHLRSKIMVTRQCNNRCTYCILDLEAETMTPETARAMDAFYIEEITRQRPLRVTDAYSGGEPLLNLDIIVQSASRRHHFCLGKGIEYGFSVTTNGTLLTSEVVGQLLGLGLTVIRVSMAGPADVHDRLRPSAKGQGTYATIMDNLAAVSGMVPITIECQYDAGSEDFGRIPEMMDDLVRRKIRIADMAFTPILAKRGDDRFCAGMGTPGQMQYLQAEAMQRGLATNPEAPANTCQADFRAFYVFDTDGSIIPCSSLQCGELAYGHVRTGIDFVAEAQLLTRRLPDQCLKHCELLPVCMGGCRLQALAQEGDFNGIDCHYGMYARLLEDWIRARAASVLAAQAA
ncbi:radical SAM/SPASM domain-containing protein [Desulfosarcina ovata subsp. sediminis]|uniref:Radical SAM/SPASM domain-containing protein n=1 Tax=Desulfosarcina ovata subsp. sediminis TaxID=885957 RepID=A0A5K7ZTQ1_9BACT|nr:radical SAM protein [Desulfosarcina ovata]BBO83601.1 radical SAM/SPASM domain-containing protein [Desulfosarcina ovata subsp. sediminis]